jgi:hypothetical protein
MEPGSIHNHVCLVGGRWRHSDSFAENARPVAQARSGGQMHAGSIRDLENARQRALAARRVKRGHNIL